MAKTGPKRKYEFEREQLDEMYQRMSLADIARHFGCGETLIWKWIHKFRITFKGGKSGKHRKRKPFTAQHLERMSKARQGKRSGENSPNWRGGIHAINLRQRATGAYKQWKIASRKRAGNRCESCGVANGTECLCCGTKITLHCHHIKSFAKFPEYRFDPENSRVLCPKCHKHEHNGKIG